MAKLLVIHKLTKIGQVSFCAESAHIKVFDESHVASSAVGVVLML